MLDFALCVPVSVRTDWEQVGGFLPDKEGNAVIMRVRGVFCGCVCRRAAWPR